MRFDVDESTTILSELLEWAGMRPGCGAAKRRMWIADNFDDPMPDIEAAFAGEA